MLITSPRHLYFQSIPINHIAYSIICIIGFSVTQWGIFRKFDRAFFLKKQQNLSHVYAIKVQISPEINVFRNRE